MELGAFSISLAVKDLQASKAFYEKFGFTVFAGEASQNWLIIKSGEHAIGLFQGMFEKNTLTFNPGWDSNAGKLDTFTDVRDLQRQLKAEGVQLGRVNTTGQNVVYWGYENHRSPISSDRGQLSAPARQREHLQSSSAERHPVCGRARLQVARLARSVR